jgi:methyl-accepting chemotaxis protein
LGKELFDGIRAKLSSLEKKFESNEEAKNLVTLTTLALVNMETGQRGYLLSGKEGSLDPYKNGKKDLVNHLREMDKFVIDTQVTTNDIKSVEEAVNKWQTEVANIEIEARRAMNNYKLTIDDLIKDMAKGIGKNYMDTIRAKIQIIVQDEEKMIIVRAKSQTDTANFATNFTLIGTIIAVFLGLIIAFVITKNITTMISSFQTGLLGFFKYLNKEEDDVELLNDKNTDEIGTMAKTVNENITKIKKGIEEDKKVIENTIAVLSELEQGDLYKRVKETTSNPALQQLTELLNKMGENMERNLNGILNVLDEYANYNYMNKANTNGVKEHLLKLATGVNTLGDAITSTLVENKKMD